MTRRKLNKAFEALDVRKQNKDYLIPGILGFLINGQQTVEVPGRNGYVYVRLRSNLNEVVQAYNDQVSPVYNLPVVIVRDEIDITRYKIQGRDLIIDALSLTRNSLELERANTDDTEVKKIIGIFINDIDERIAKINDENDLLIK